MRDIEERLVRLGMQIHVFLRRAAAWTVVGEVTAFTVKTSHRSVVGPEPQLLGQVLVHRPDVGDRESSQWIA